MPEEEGDNMAETHDESENGVVEEFRVQGPELDEAGSSTPSTLRPSSLTVLLGQTFNAVTTVEPKSAQTRGEEEVRKYLEAPSLPLTDNPLVVALQRSCVPSPSQTCQTTLVYSWHERCCRKSVLHCGGHCVSITEYAHSTTCGPAGLPP